jgi:hypothetical protein
VKKELRENALTILALLVICIAMWLPRGLSLDVFVTPDEPKWLTRSANFFNALAQRDFASTYQKEHPGVTIMWAGTAGFLTTYPSYVKIGPGQQERPQQFKRFLDNQEISAMPILEAGRQFVMIAIITAAALSFLAAKRLVGLLAAFVGYWLIAFDPFLIALSRLLHLDGLVSALMLLSILFFLCYLYRGRRWLDLLISAAAAAMSWLTKSPALFLLPFLGLICMIELGRVWLKSRRLTWSDLWRLTLPMLAWTGAGVILFVLVWPAMWVDPIHALGQIFGGAATYAAEGHESITFFNGSVHAGGISDWRFYPVSYLWRATIPVLVGLVLLLATAIWRRRFPASREQQLTAFYLVLFAVLFTVFMTSGAKKFDRYLLPVFAPLDILAGLGWVIFLKLNLPSGSAEKDAGGAASSWKRPAAFALLAAAMLLQTYSAQQVHPYYFNYYNPLLGGPARAPQVMMIGWGEGLDQAARYLNDLPEASDLKAASWYADGPFSYIFSGETSLKDLPIFPQDLPKVDYLVLYTHQWQRQLPSREFLAYFDNLTPERIVTIGDLEYARIYRLR